METSMNLDDVYSDDDDDGSCGLDSWERDWLDDDDSSDDENNDGSSEAPAGTNLGNNYEYLDNIIPSMNSNHLQESNQLVFHAYSDGRVEYDDTNNTEKSSGDKSLMYGNSIESMTTTAMDKKQDLRHNTQVVKLLSYEANLTKSNNGYKCSEINVIKLIIEMMLGNNNDFFLINNSNVDITYCRLNNITLSYSARTCCLLSLSSIILVKLLEYFATIGSYLNYCRSYTSHNKIDSNDILSRIEGQFKVAISDLLVNIDNELTVIDYEISTVPNPKYHEDGIRIKRCITKTILGLFSHFKPYEALLRSVAGYIMSVESCKTSNYVGSNYTLICVTSILQELYYTIQSYSMSYQSNRYDIYKCNPVFGNEEKRYSLSLDLPPPRPYFNLFHIFILHMFNLGLEEFILKFMSNIWSSQDHNGQPTIPWFTENITRKENLFPTFIQGVAYQVINTKLDMQILQKYSTKLINSKLANEILRFSSLLKAVKNAVSDYRVFTDTNDVLKNLSSRYGTFHSIENGISNLLGALDDKMASQRSIREREIPSSDSALDNVIEDKDYLNYFSASSIINCIGSNIKQETVKIVKPPSQTSIHQVFHYNFTPLHTQLSALVLAPLYRTIRDASLAAVNYINEKYHLFENFRYLQDVFLLAQYQAKQSLYVEKYEALRLLDNEIYHNNEQNSRGLLTLFSNLSESISSRLDTTKPENGVTYVTFASSFLSKLSSNYQEISLTGDDTSIIKLIHGVTVEVQHSWPLSEIFSPSTLIRYNNILKFLLLLNINKWRIEKIWKVAMSSSLLMTNTYDDKDVKGIIGRCRAGLALLINSIGAISSHYRYVVTQSLVHSLSY